MKILLNFLALRTFCDANAATTVISMNFRVYSAISSKLCGKWKKPSRVRNVDILWLRTNMRATHVSHVSSVSKYRV